MAGLAINVVTLLAALQRCCNCFWIRASGKFIAVSVAMPAGKEIAVRIQLLLVHILVIELRDGAGHRIASRSAIRIELAGTQRNKLGLVMHVLPAAGNNGHAPGSKQQPRNSDVCPAISAAPLCFL